MARIMTLAIALALAGCSASVADVAHTDSDPTLECSLEDSAGCAIDVYRSEVSEISNACADVVYATAVTLGVTREVVEACGPDVMGCVTSYGPAGASVMVLNDADRVNTAVHELLHVALRCTRGNFDATHTKYGSVWVGLLSE